MIILHGDFARREVALVFDDGPNPQVTPPLLDVLKAKNVPATFFLIGARAEQYPHIARRIAQEGHEIGNHTYTHKRLTQLLRAQGEQAVKDEITRGAQAISGAAGIDPARIRFLRPPYFDWDDDVARIAAPLYESRVIMASLAAEDYQWGGDHQWNEHAHAAIAAQAAHITAAWQKDTRPGTLLAFHDGAEYNLPGNKTYASWMNRALPTLAAIPAIIDFLHSQGYAIKTLSTMHLTQELQASTK